MAFNSSNFLVTFISPRYKFINDSFKELIIRNKIKAHRGCDQF